MEDIGYLRGPRFSKFGYPWGSRISKGSPKNCRWISKGSARLTWISKGVSILKNGTSSTWGVRTISGKAQFRYLNFAHSWAFCAKLRKTLVLLRSLELLIRFRKEQHDTLFSLSFNFWLASLFKNKQVCLKGRKGKEKCYLFSFKYLCTMVLFCIYTRLMETSSVAYC